MNYKDLFERYKKGLLSEDEKKLVEEELERHEAVEDYLSTAIDEEFDDLEASYSPNNQEETIKVKKSVNKWVKKIILSSVLIVVALYIGVFHVLSGVIERMYYNPTIVSDRTDEGNPLPDSHFALQAYIGLNMPGYSVNSATYSEAKGFGNYEMNYSLLNNFKEEMQRYSISLSKGEITYGIDGIFSRRDHSKITGQFNVFQYEFPQYEMTDEDYSRWQEHYQRKNEETLNYLEQLNPLSYVSMNIVFEDDLTMEEFYDISNEHPPYPTPLLEFKWVGIRTMDPEIRLDIHERNHLLGFNPTFYGDLYSLEQPDREKYPMFYLSDFHGIGETSITINDDYPKRHAEAYETHFKTRLEYLINNEGFLEVFNEDLYNNEFYEEAFDYVEENGVKTFGALAYGTAEEFIKALNIIEYEQLHINEVVTARPYIYY